jgi:pyruvate dehydrogenase E2 component (dihydrolipoamide acetyltransferase)
MIKEIKFIDVGEGITEGHIQKWLVKDGEEVKEDQSVLQVETDKAVVNVPSPIDGTIKIIVKEGAIVHIGDLIAQIGSKDEITTTAAAEVQSPTPQPEQKKPEEPVKNMEVPQSQQVQVETTQGKEIIATPYVRKLAKDLNVDLTKVTATGPNGRILENDVRNFGVKETVAQTPVPKFSEVLEEKHTESIERIPLSQTRKAIAKNMEASWQIPRATHMDLINATNLFSMVMREKQKLAKDMNVHLTFLPFIIKATIAAIKENPNFNSSYDHEALEIIRKNYYNIGIAVTAEDGLKVVVVKDADKKTIVQLAKEIQELAEKAKNKTITLEEMQDSTFTITNIGSLGGGFLSVPMINPPNVAILGVHLIRDWPMVTEGMVKVGKMMPFSLVFDHRVVDGADAVKFGNVLIKYLEDPDLLDML